MKIIGSTSQKVFDAVLHMCVYDPVDFMKREIVMASYLGLPESVKAISASILSGYSVKLVHQKQMDHNRYVRISQGNYHRMEKPVGLGDVVHGIVYHSQLTLAGIEKIVTNSDNKKDKEKNEPVAYIIALDGDIRKAVSEHLIARYGLPEEWKEQYPDLVMEKKEYVKELEIIHNPAFDIWKNAKAIKLEVTEKRILDMIDRHLKEGRFRIPPSNVQGVFRPGMTTSEYIRENVVHLAKKLGELKPYHDFSDPLHPEIARMGRIPFPAQAHMIQGLYNRLVEDGKTDICNADMGTGKSIIACGVMHLMYKNRPKSKKGMAVLLAAPGITLTKWVKNEILPTLPYAKVNILQSTEDALKLLKKIRGGYRPSGLEVTLVGLDRIKFGPEPYFAGVWKRIAQEKDAYAWHCPDCGEPLKVKGVKDFIPADWEAAAEGKPPTEEELQIARVKKELLPNGLPKWFKVVWSKSKRISKCQACGAKLYRPALRSRGETKNRPRWFISRILKKARKYFDLFICDEVHQTKAEGTGRGNAFGKVVKAAKNNLLLTGTLLNGKSSSVKEILWRTDPGELLEAGITHETGQIEWAARYGKLKEVIRLNNTETGWTTEQKRVALQPTEEPGIAPQLVAQFLLHKTAFLELPDLGLPLVEIKEEPIFVKMDDHHYEAYSEFHRQLEEQCKQRSIAGGRGVWSKFIPATINYADRPDLEHVVRFGFEKEDVRVSAVRFPEDYYHAKERKLVQLVKENLAEGRGVIIFNNYTAKFGLNERLRDVLKQHGITSVRILKEPDPMKRQQVLEKYAEEGVKVIICNMKLVEVGLDLLAWPTIIFYQLSYDVNMVRQASRRAWRIGQNRECRVYYLVYNGTQQMAQFLKVMAGRGHAMMAEGKLDKSELSRFSIDSQSALAADLAQCIATEEVADAWKELAKRDVADIRMVAEAEFAQVLKEEMKRLTDETRRLCGVLVEAAENEAEEAAADLAQGGKEQVLDVPAAVSSERRPALAQDAPDHSDFIVDSDADFIQLDLFSLPEPQEQPPQNVIPISKAENGEQRIRLVVVQGGRKGKRKKSAEPIEGQLAFDWF